MDRGALDALIARAMRSDPANVRRFEICTPFSRPGSSLHMKHCVTTYEVNVSGFLIVLRRTSVVEEHPQKRRRDNRYIFQLYADSEQLVQQEGPDVRPIYEHCESLLAKVEVQ